LGTTRFRALPAARVGVLYTLTAGKFSAPTSYQKANSCNFPGALPSGASPYLVIEISYNPPGRQICDTRKRLKVRGTTRFGCCRNFLHRAGTPAFRNYMKFFLINLLAVEGGPDGPCSAVGKVYSLILLCRCLPRLLIIYQYDRGVGMKIAQV
jgi:hypothetical protein